MLPAVAGMLRQFSALKQRILSSLGYIGLERRRALVRFGWIELVTL
jgi:hypothetical protein